MKRRRWAVTVAAVAVMLLAGAARATHPAALHHAQPRWCDGIDDSTDEAGYAAVEDKKTCDISLPNMCVWLPVRERRTSRDVHRACEGGEKQPRAMSLLFRPLLRTARSTSAHSSADPELAL